MEKVKLISESRKDYLKLLMKDPRISRAVLINSEIPQSMVINDDGSVTFGLTPTRWWNFLFRSHVRISFSDLAFRIRNALAEYTPEFSGFKDALKEEIVENAIDAHNYDYVIDRLFLNAILGVTEGEYKIKKTKEGNLRQPSNKSGRDHSRVGRVQVGLDLGGGCIPLDLYIEERD